ncbi:MAG: 2-amino-4-hydroxy-6-hydroxymethyldihydropteridine diphosphokinase [Gammaproteobacteria bacterium]|jgi:2-amino-4-hydroxy-6-hydroxymethyldihydropteridine diphosphokinase|nr:2-amino-4-hydroxy-6-hydroxymethyldihydropteridine diphosphokinase [Gammaproteobacteria bacterium]MBT3725916.1 2-amino-4-hydroxy-6-hydroxymethyldihydropteridine diphosphokinase [Gammaproteobacteria bacterium]MBT4076144.1 2-amino-4-hydroxy-6-hydroxymethyldihydropteridine diphosphokinase [Gammaproteobacteria bacterium]MBT4195855.1 2-amino-4-hydroxy-6-hydroxymethyldihydropteridine diphosphokinase [Gammaproteobacteria bacterium]MBT4448963.1 2-amino-4-hydroxy-6-hydroxymethyldihydropteridine diphos
MTALVTISLGSNINPEHNIRLAIIELQQKFEILTISPVYQTAAVGFDGDDFLNLVVSFNSVASVQDIAAELKAIEDRIGRDRSQPKFSARSIDLDLLTYDQLILDEPGVQVPRHEILKNAFVLKPLSDIQGSVLHPEQQKSYHLLWLEMEKNADRIELYEMSFK